MNGRKEGRKEEGKREGGKEGKKKRRGKERKERQMTKEIKNGKGMKERKWERAGGREAGRTEQRGGEHTFVIPASGKSFLQGCFHTFAFPICVKVLFFVLTFWCHSWADSSFSQFRHLTRGVEGVSGTPALLREFSAEKMVNRTNASKFTV
jgi:hypothetical protein